MLLEVQIKRVKKKSIDLEHRFVEQRENIINTTANVSKPNLGFPRLNIFK